MPFQYQDSFPLGKDQTEYRKLTSEYVKTVEFDGKTILKVDGEAIKLLSKEALKDVSFLLRATHLEK